MIASTSSEHPSPPVGPSSNGEPSSGSRTPPVDGSEQKARDVRGGPDAVASSQLQGLLGLMLTLLGFSLTGVWVKWLVALDPFSLTGWRVLAALLLLLPAVAWTSESRRKAWAGIRAPGVHALALRMTAFFVTAVGAFQQAPVALVLLCVGLAPAWVVAFERAAGRPVSGIRMVGVGCALTGAAVGLLPAVVGGSLGPSANILVGVAGGLASGLCSAAYTVGRPHVRDVHGELPSAFLLSALACAWGVSLIGVGWLTQLGAVGPRTWAEGAAIIGFAGLSTALPLWGVSVSSRALPPLWSALVFPTIPFSGAMAAWLLLGEVPPLTFALGAPLVVVGVSMVVGLGRSS